MNSVRGGVPVTLAALTVLMTAVAGCTLPAPATSSEPAASVPSDAPSPPADPLGLGDIDWIYTPPPITLGGPDGAYVLQAGTLVDEEPLVDLEVPWRAEMGEGIFREPAIGAPHGGAVVYVADDGTQSEVRRVEIAAGGAVGSLATLGAVVWDIVVAPDGSAAYAAIVDRADNKRDLGVVQILLDGSGSVEPIVPPAPVAAAVGVRRVAVIAFQVDLSISSDGQQLVRRTCQEAGSCLVQVIELATGRALELPEHEVLGVAAGVIVARRCDVRGCDLEAMDIETGAIAAAGRDVFGPVVLVGETPVVVTIAADIRGTITVEAVDPATGKARVLHRVPDGTDVVFGDFLDLQLNVPDGFVHIIEMRLRGEGPGVDQRHLLISVNDGRSVEIPAPAVHRPPGFGTQG